MKITTEIDGVEALLKTLDVTLNQYLLPKASKKAVTSGARIIVRETKVQAVIAFRYGFTVKSMGQKVLTRKAKDGVVSALVGPRVMDFTGPNGEIEKPYLYAHFADTGTKDRYTGFKQKLIRYKVKGTGKRETEKIALATGNPIAFRGRVDPRYFMEKAAQISQASVEETMIQVYKSELIVDRK